MKAVLIGATGLTGSVLLAKLIENENFSHVVVLVRKSTGIHHSKFEEHIIDFESPDTWKNFVSGDVLFSCLGTTLKKAGSKALQYKVDVDYQLEVAKAAVENNIHTYILVSARGASLRSPFFYMRMKAELEYAVQKLPFRNIHILRPNILDGQRNEHRTGEMLALRVIKTLNALGLLLSMKPTRVNHLTNEMIHLALKSLKAE